MKSCCPVACTALEHKLFLSATPHNGYRESFAALLELLDNQRFARAVTPDRAQLEAVMVRRMKSELKLRWDGSRRFAERVVRHLEVPYTDDERRAHRDLQAYSEMRRRCAPAIAGMTSGSSSLRNTAPRARRAILCASGSGKVADEALTLLQSIYDQFTEGFGTPDLIHAEALLEGLRANSVNKVAKDETHVAGSAAD